MVRILKKETSYLSAVILAGGKSRRIGTDKAFLQYKGQPFIKMIATELHRVATEVAVVIGRKDKRLFKEVLGPAVRIVKDEYDLGNPMGGMITGADSVRNPYVVFVGCDCPLLNAEVLRYLHSLAFGHSAAIPIWENGNTEPPCSVYNSEEARNASRQALYEGRIGCKNLISYLRDPVYVSVDKLRKYDGSLGSLVNVNTENDLNFLYESRAVA